MTVAVVVPVYGNEATLVELATRIEAALTGRAWRLRLVIDASPDGSAAVARRLTADPRIAVTELTANVGQHAALTRGLSDEPEGAAWVCLDADLQDPPEALPLLLARLGPASAVFAGRRGTYETRSRLLTGTLHRRLMTALTGLPPDAGAYVAMDARARAAVLSAGAPSLVAAIGAARLPVTSVPVVRAERPVGASAWTVMARLRQSARTLLWTARHRRC